jgi:hypothetical protein
MYLGLFGSLYVFTHHSPLFSMLDIRYRYLSTPGSFARNIVLSRCGVLSCLLHYHLLVPTTAVDPAIAPHVRRSSLLERRRHLQQQQIAATLHNLVVKGGGQDSGTVQVGLSVVLFFFVFLFFCFFFSFNMFNTLVLLKVRMG